MDPRLNIYNVIRFTALVAALSTLPACQQTRNSSVDRSQPTPQGPPPGVVPGRPGVGPVGPGVYVPPPAVQRPPLVVQQPPGGGQPTQPTGPVVPLPRQTTPTDEVPPRRPPPVTTTDNTGADPTPRPTVTQLPETPARPIVVATADPNPTGSDPRPTSNTPATPLVIPGAEPTAAQSYPTVVTQPLPPVAQNIPSAPMAPTGSAIVATQAGPRSAIVVGGVNPMVAYQPVILGDLRVITPNRSNVLATCLRADCAPAEKVFTPDCRNPQNAEHCDIQTVRVLRAKPQLTCPEIELRERPYTSKLDILFVVDTSASMKEERQEIARQMVNFIAELSPDVEYHVAVMLGHGPNSKKARVGEIFDGGSKVHGGVILQDSILSGKRQSVARYNPRASTEEIEVLARKETAQLVASTLAEIMAKVPNDDSEVQGEAGLLNLYTAVTDSRMLQEMKSKEFWRDTAAKSVIFVADENDVCFDYEAESKRAGQTVEARAKTVDKSDKYKRDPVEIASFDKICRTAAHGRQLTPEIVHEAVVRSSAMPIAFSGILYLDNKSFSGKTDKYAKDNEMGRGYLEVISLGVGKAADLSKADFGKSLAKIGDFTNFKMKYDHVFPMSNVKNVRDIDPLTVSVAITDPQTRQEQMFNAANVKLEIDEQKNTAKVLIAYEVLAKVYSDGMVKKGSKIIIRYSTKEGVPEEDAPAHKAAPDAPAAAAAQAPQAQGVEAQTSEAGVPAAPSEEEKKKIIELFGHRFEVSPSNPFGSYESP